MKVDQQPAYLLHARPFSETSLLVDLFTREYGRLMLIAKGAPSRPISITRLLARTAAAVQTAAGQLGRQGPVAHAYLGGAERA